MEMLSGSQGPLELELVKTMHPFLFTALDHNVRMRRLDFYRLKCERIERAALGFCGEKAANKAKKTQKIPQNWSPDSEALTSFLEGCIQFKLNVKLFAFLVKPMLETRYFRDTMFIPHGLQPDGRSPFMLACLNCASLLVLHQHLSEHSSAQVRLYLPWHDSHHYTALHLLIQNSHNDNYNCSQVLRCWINTNRAQVLNARDWKGRTILDYAYEKNRKFLIPVIEAAFIAENHKCPLPKDFREKKLKEECKYEYAPSGVNEMDVVYFDEMASTFEKTETAAIGKELSAETECRPTESLCEDRMDAFDAFDQFDRDDDVEKGMRIPLPPRNTHDHKDPRFVDALKTDIVITAAGGEQFIAPFGFDKEPRQIDYKEEEESKLQTDEMFCETAAAEALYKKGAEESDNVGDDILDISISTVEDVHYSVVKHGVIEEDNEDEESSVVTDGGYVIDPAVAVVCEKLPVKAVESAIAKESPSKKQSSPSALETFLNELKLNRLEPFLAEFSLDELMQKKRDELLKLFKKIPGGAPCFPRMWRGLGAKTGQWKEAVLKKKAAAVRVESDSDEDLGLEGNWLETCHFEMPEGECMAANLFE